MKTLDDIIDETKEAGEIKRALAVKMILLGFEVKDIESLLNISDSFISKWKHVYSKEGAESLLLKYKGSEGYLNEIQRKEVISFLKSKTYFSPEELRDYLESEYGVVYKSRQSYYCLLDEGGLSWKKTEKVNPKHDENKILEVREEIRDVIKKNEEEIRKGETVLIFEDESHLLWGDTIGYIWGRKGEKVEIPIANTMERQTYFGAVNAFTGTFHCQSYESGNGECTVEFVKLLQKEYEDKKIIIVWDKASYHRFGKMREYLGEINKGIPKKDWNVRCLSFAPNGPEQNPVEDIWLKGKNFLRKNFYENKTFNDVKSCFIKFLRNTKFDFPKLHLYNC